MNDKDELKARVESLIDDVDYYLRNYKRLIQIGYGKSVLDAEIQLLIKEIKWLWEEIWQKERPLPTGSGYSFPRNNLQIISIYGH